MIIGKFDKYRRCESNGAFVFTISDCLKIIKSDSSAVGIVINPYSHNLVLNRDKLDSLKLNVENNKQNERVSIGIPAEYPRKLVNDCTHCFKQESEINKAYMLQMIRENLKKSLLLM